MIIKNRVMHTPEGMRDLYGKSLQDRRALMKRIHDVFESFGYSDIETPTIEYFDVFSSDIGTTPSNELYKFFDRDGNTLVLRPDFTPSVARAAAMHFADSDFPLRLSYEGSTFVNSAEYQGRLKESRQMGVELIGEDSAEADAEIIALTCRMLLASGLKEFQVSVGEVNFYKALADKSGLDEESTETVRELISNKNFFGVAEVLDGTRAAPEVKEAMQKLPQLFGSAEIFDAAEAFALGKREKSAVEGSMRSSAGKDLTAMSPSISACSQNIIITPESFSLPLPTGQVSRSPAADAMTCFSGTSDGRIQRSASGSILTS